MQRIIVSTFLVFRTMNEYILYLMYILPLHLLNDKYYRETEISEH